MITIVLPEDLKELTTDEIIKIIEYINSKDVISFQQKKKYNHYEINKSISIKDLSIKCLEILQSRNYIPKEE